MCLYDIKKMEHCSADKDIYNRCAPIEILNDDKYMPIISPPGYTALPKIRCRSDITQLSHHCRPQKGCYTGYHHVQTVCAQTMMRSNKHDKDDVTPLYTQKINKIDYKILMLTFKCSSK